MPLPQLTTTITLHHANSVWCRNFGIHGIKSCLPYSTNVCVLEFRTHECFSAFHSQQISMLSWPETFSRTVGMIKQKTTELIFLKTHLASSALFLSLAALLFILLDITFTNASRTAE